MKKNSLRHPKIQERLYSIQALRGVAAFLVLIFHLNAILYSGAKITNQMGAFWANGFAGVDMFFVISGFIMVYVTRNIVPGFKNSIRFLFSRIARIYPLWWFFASLMIIYFSVTYGQASAPDKVTGANIAPHIIKSLLLLPQRHDPVFGVGWTLIHEMLFYSLFALCLLISQRYLPIILMAWAVLIVVIGFISNGQPLHAQNFQQLLTSPLNIEFVFGAFAALAFHSFKEKSGFQLLPRTLFWLGIVLFILALMIPVPGKKNMFNWARVIMFGLPCTLIVFSVACVEQKGKLKVSTPLIELGNWSYSLYLSHMLVLLGLRRIWQTGAAEQFLPEQLKWGALGPFNELAFIFLALFLSIFTAWLSYHTIERTSIRIFKALLKLQNRAN